MRWNESKLNRLMTEEFEKVLGLLTPCKKDAELQTEMETLASRMLSEEWLHAKGRISSARSVRIRSGVSVKHRVHKATGGLIAPISNSFHRGPAPRRGGDRLAHSKR